MTLPADLSRCRGEPTITVPAPLFRALFAAAQAVCEDSVPYDYPSKGFVTSDDFLTNNQDLVDADLITDLRAALEPLKEVGATPYFRKRLKEILKENAA